MSRCLSIPVGLVSLVWFGLVWFGLVWFGLVWFGLCPWCPRSAGDAGVTVCGPVVPAQGITHLEDMCKAELPEHQRALDSAAAMVYFSVTEPGARVIRVIDGSDDPFDWLIAVISDQWCVT